MRYFITALAPRAQYINLWWLFWLFFSSILRKVLLLLLRWKCITIQKKKTCYTGPGYTWPWLYFTPSTLIEFPTPFVQKKRDVYWVRTNMVVLYVWDISESDYAIVTPTFLLCHGQETCQMYTLQYVTSYLYHQEGRTCNRIEETL